jgi:hypothetical protein
VDPNPEHEALALVTDVLPSTEADIREAFAADPVNWWCELPFRLWGIAMRNLLRSRGHDPEDYVFLVERALKLR